MYPNATFMQSQASTIQKTKPRIASAAHTTTTVGQSNPNLNRDNSQGFSSTLVNSQGDLNFIDPNGQNVIQGDDRIKSAANKYRHRIPSTEAI